MTEVTIQPMGERRYGVQAEEGHERTSHVVSVPDELLDELVIPLDDEARHEALVRETFQFLLEREPATSILREFDLTDIDRYFPEYREEIARRLATRG